MVYAMDNEEKPIHKILVDPDVDLLLLPPLTAQNYIIREQTDSQTIPQQEGSDRQELISFLLHGGYVLLLAISVFALLCAPFFIHFDTGKGSAPIEALWFFVETGVFVLLFPALHFSYDLVAGDYVILEKVVDGIVILLLIVYGIIASILLWRLALWILIVPAWFAVICCYILHRELRP